MGKAGKWENWKIGKAGKRESGKAGEGGLERLEEFKVHRQVTSEHGPDKDGLPTGVDGAEWIDRLENEKRMAGGPSVFVSVNDYG